MKTATQVQAVRGPYRTPQHCSAIRRMRVAAGLTQPNAAKQAGVSLRTFQRAESGDVVPIAVKRQIERAFGVAW